MIGLLSILFYAILAVFVLGVTAWAVIRIRGIGYDEPPREWGSDDVQVRIVTVGDSVSTIQHTVDNTIRHFDDVRVISERNIDVDGAQVHVVPDDFESTAIRKGRAMDWAATVVERDQEYVLYLDEDTVVPEFDGVPDADIVQFGEKPQMSGSAMAWMIDAVRAAFQTETFGFVRQRYPLYLWGGGFAVRGDVEQSVGWDVPTIAEDTVFLWRARNEGHTYAVSKQWFENQAPGTIGALVQQRRRWFSGTLDAISFLPWHWTMFVVLRNLTAMASVLTVPVIVAGLSVVSVPLWVAVVLALPLVVWSVYAGVMYENVELLVASLVLFPVWHTLNALGVVYGVLFPTNDFTVTPKE